MIAASLVQADTGPEITSILTYNDGTPVDLSQTDTLVRFQMRESADRRFTVNAPADITDGAAGEVSYTWGANDLSRPGDYQIQWQVTFPDGTIITSDPPEEITVRRQ